MHEYFWDLLQPGCHGEHGERNAVEQAGIAVFNRNSERGDGQSKDGGRFHRPDDQRHTIA